VKRGSKRRNRRKKILAAAKGYYQRKSKLFRYAKEAVERGQKFAYVCRRLKKREYRGLWIIRVAAAARSNGLSYSKLIHGLKLAGIDLNRKILAEMAVHDAPGFAQVVAAAKKAIDAQPAREAPAAD
jgi:large subunit ribosomal protein L20